MMRFEWKGRAVTIVCTIIAGLLLTGAVHFTCGVFEEKPGTCVFLGVYGKSELSMDFDDLQASLAFTSLLSPEDSELFWDVLAVSSVWMLEEPVSVRLYAVCVENRGEGADTNVRVELRFEPSGRIRSVDVGVSGRIVLAEGGEASHYVVFVVDELLPYERQVVYVVVDGTDFSSLDVWSERLHVIDDINVIAMIWRFLVED